MIFFSDLDGTFLTTQKEITPAAWRALDAVAEAGMQFVPCSGRPFAGLDPELLAHPAVHYAVYANGASVCDAKTGELLHRVCLGRERAETMYAAARERDVTFDVFADGKCYAMRRHYDRMAEFMPDPGMLASMRRTRTPVDLSVEEILASARDVERISMYWKDPADRDALWPVAESLDHVAVVRSYPMNIEVSDADGTKGGALVWLCGHLGIPLEQSMAFGDSLNDVPMIKAAGTGVAMANSDADALAAADIVAPDNDEDGVAQTIMACLEGRLGH